MCPRTLVLCAALLLAACGAPPNTTPLDEIAASFGITDAQLHCETAEDWVVPPSPDTDQPIERIPVRACWPAGSDTSLFVAYDERGGVRRIQRRWVASHARYDSIVATLIPVLGTGDSACFGHSPLDVAAGREWQQPMYYVILGMGSTHLVLDYRKGTRPYHSSCAPA